MRATHESGERERKMPGRDLFDSFLGFCHLRVKYMHASARAYNRQQLCVTGKLFLSSLQKLYKYHDQKKIIRRC
jgi:hypothetical protein